MARTLVSDTMWEGNPIVRGLRDRLCDNLVNTTGGIQNGQLKADATDSVYNQGFPLQVKRRDGSGNVSIFAIKDGTLLVTPLRADLERMLPGHQRAINSYIELSARWGCDPDHSDDSPRRCPRLVEVGDEIIRDMDELARCAQALANDPASDSSS